MELDQDLFVVVIWRSSNTLTCLLNKVYNRIMIFLADLPTLKSVKFGRVRKSSAVRCFILPQCSAVRCGTRFLLSSNLEYGKSRDCSRSILEFQV